MVVMMPAGTPMVGDSNLYKPCNNDMMTFCLPFPFEARAKKI